MGRIGRDRLAWWKSAAKWVGAVAVGLGFIAAMGWFTWWLIDVPSPDPAMPGAGSGNVEMVRTVLTAMVGAGGLVTLVVVIRRQWSQEQAHKLAVRIADDTQHDATERRITELYMTAAEQLGHEKASVRLAALYALDRLGRNHEGHRQEVVDIWCAYLRQPFTPPARFVTEEEATAEPPRPVPVDSTVDAYLTPPPQATNTNPATRKDEEEAREQEYEVRATAQRLLIRHLKDPRPEDERTEEPPPASADGHWQLDRIDLTGATLIAIDFRYCRLPQADFTRAHFHGDAWFLRVRFHGGARFTSANFHGDARFDDARFHGIAWFERARFHGDAWFVSVRFHGEASFTSARFHGIAWFVSARFHGGAWCTSAYFYKNARFTSANFRGGAWFDSAHFHGNTWFKSAHFHEGALFSRVVVGEHSVLYFEGARAVWELSDGAGARIWPPGWRLMSLAEGEGEPGWGRLEATDREDPSLPSSPASYPSLLEEGVVNLLVAAHSQGTESSGSRILGAHNSFEHPLT